MKRGKLDTGGQIALAGRIAREQMERLRRLTLKAVETRDTAGMLMGLKLIVYAKQVATTFGSEWVIETAKLKEQGIDIAAMRIPSTIEDDTNFMRDSLMAARALIVCTKNLIAETPKLEGPEREQSEASLDLARSVLNDVQNQLVEFGQWYNTAPEAQWLRDKENEDAANERA